MLCFIALRRCCVFYKLKVRPCTSREIVTCSLGTFAILRWSRTKLAISPRYTCILEFSCLKGRHNKNLWVIGYHVSTSSHFFWIFEIVERKTHIALKTQRNNLNYLKTQMLRGFDITVALPTLTGLILKSHCTLNSETQKRPKEISVAFWQVAFWSLFCAYMYFHTSF